MAGAGEEWAGEWAGEEWEWDGTTGILPGAFTTHGMVDGAEAASMADGTAGAGTGGTEALVITTGPTTTASTTDTIPARSRGFVQQTL